MEGILLAFPVASSHSRIFHIHGFGPRTFGMALILLDFDIPVFFHICGFGPPRFVRGSILLTSFLTISHSRYTKSDDQYKDAKTDTFIREFEKTSKIE